MAYIDRVCHNCKHCEGKHKNDNGIPTAMCKLRNRTVIEYHITCDNFQLASKASKKQKESA